MFFPVLEFIHSRILRFYSSHFPSIKCTTLKFFILIWSFQSSSAFHVHYTIFAMNSSNHESQGVNSQVLAVIFDLDGTLVNTENATKDVLKEFLAKYGRVLKNDKGNWRLGMTQKESTAAIIENYDLPITPEQYIKEIHPLYREKWSQARSLPGANRLIRHLHEHGIPFGLASNSLRPHIDAKLLHYPGWKKCFSVILGSDQVPAGKPAPDIYEEAAKRMQVDAKHCLVIEDSSVGVEAAKAAGMKVVAVPSLNESNRISNADEVLHSLIEFQPELWGLPPFEDWVDNALPIEPIHVNGIVNNGFLSEVTGADNGLNVLIDQVHGIYLGWGMVTAQEIFKVVLSVGWDHSCCTAKKKMQLCVVGEEKEFLNQNVQLSLVGYIRRSKQKEIRSKDVEIIEEDKSTANSSLELPIFSHSWGKPFLADSFLDGTAVDNH